MSWDFDSIPKYVINLDRRKDRWQQFQNVSGIEELTNLRHWPAIDGKLLNLDEEKDISLFTKIQYYSWYSSFSYGIKF